MQSKTIQALLALSLLVLAGCGSASKGNLAPPLVFPTTAPTPSTLAGVPTPSTPAGLPPLSIYLSSANLQGDADNFVAAIDAISGQQRWKYAAKAQVENPVTLYQGIVYIGAADHKLYALDGGNGAVRWSYNMEDSLPTVAAGDNGVIYAYIYQNGSSQSAPFSLYALNARDGSLIWRSSINGIMSVIDGVVYVQALDNTLYALNISDGSITWHSQVRGAINTVQDGLLYVTAPDEYFYALNASDGSVRWKFQPAYPPMFEQIADGTVYLLASPEGQNGSGPNSILYALNANTGALQWQYPGGSDQENVQWIGAANGVAYLTTTTQHDFAHPQLALALKVRNGALDWRFQLNSQTASIQSAMLDTDGVVYLENSDSTLSALSASDGSIRWQASVGTIHLIDNGVVYAASSNGNITALNAQNGLILWHYQPDTPLKILKVSNGLLYLSTLPFSGPAINDVYALQTNNGTLFWRYNAGETPFFAVVG